LLPGITHVPFGNIDAMKRKITRRTAMVIVEPILGEAGVVMPPIGYLKAIREICDSTGALMVLDCVQTGMGRTGEWFGYEYEGIVPDVITLAKGLGGGLPMGAMIALGRASHLFVPGDHGSTFGGNPVACASALAAIDVIEKESLLKKVRAFEILIKSELSKMTGVVEVRGQGLLLGVVLAKDNAAKVRDSMQLRGVLVNAPSPNVIRIAPALTVIEKEVRKFISIFATTLKEDTDG
jgi:acetylornithine/N-succinyldiaminopimelate aminotransferase